MPHQSALDHLRRDAAFAAVIDRIGPCGFAADRRGTHFAHVARAIVYQQLSGKAAGTIYGRLVTRLGGTPTPARVLALPLADLRAVGLSGQKAAYIRDLAARIADRSLPVARLARLDDATIIAALTAVKGIGTWTAQMFLMFRLGRPDVLPSNDLGIRKGVQLAYRLRALPAPAQVERLGAGWSPYASVASWYLWRVADAENAARTSTKNA